MNTVEGDASIVSLNTNQFTLAAGKYEIEAIAPAYRVDRHKIKLRNVTMSLDTIIGSNSDSVNGGDYAVTTSVLKGVINIYTSTTFEIQHRGAVTYSSPDNG